MKYRMYILPFLFIAIAGCTHAAGQERKVFTPHLFDEVFGEKHIPDEIILEKSFLYDQHTLADTYPYKDTVRFFQFDKMKERLFLLDSIQQKPSAWAILQNRRNVNSVAPLVKEWKKDEYNQVADRYRVQRYQSTPLYEPGETVPERYGCDGSLVKFLGEGTDSTMYRVESYNAPGVWDVPKRYVNLIEGEVVFTKVIMIDRTNQNIATLEKSGDRWLIRSMNPATTGAHKPPYQYPTPVGMFVLQEKKPKMVYLKDGTDETGGFAPWASRFSNGAYVHGVPVNLPSTQTVEFSQTLGTIPRSHKCVRNATSHAKYVYDWAPTEGTIIFVYD